MTTAADVDPRQSLGLPRRSVIDEAWRAIGPGVEVLSGTDGAPLRRTIKRILDPLVLRLRSHPQYSAPVVTRETGAAMRALVVGQGPELRSTASWFEVLKLERRRRRITAGNAQELYFPVCFELAVTRGAPVPGDRDTVDMVLRGIHDGRDRTGTEALNRYVEDDRVVSQLSSQLNSSWHDVRPGDMVEGPFFAGLAMVLGDASGHSAEMARQRAWAALVLDTTPYDVGAKARTDAELPWSIVDIGLCSVSPQGKPAVTFGLEGAAPLDRSIVDRVRATLRRALNRDELPDIPLLCAEEVDRACAPWGLLAEDKQVTLVAGIEVAVDLSPLRADTTTRYALSRDIQARLRKEAYVLHARRYLVDGGPVDPRQRQVIDELADFARPYLRRLWARLHGRDVWQDPCDDIDDVRALLEGVARSVSLDHRQRIKTMLELRDQEVVT